MYNIMEMFEVYLYGCGFNSFSQLEHNARVSMNLPIRILSWQKYSQEVVDVCISWSSMNCLLNSHGSHHSLHSFGNNKIPEIFKNSEIQHMAMSSDFLLYHSDNKKMILRDFNGKCEICRVECDQENQSTEEKDRRCISTADDHTTHVNSNIQRLYAAETDFYSINEDGVLYKIEVRRSKNCSPMLYKTIIPLTLSVSSISCGKEHILLLTTTNQIFAWGLGSRGQLGNGDVEGIKLPQEIDALAGVNIKMISAGGWHSSAATAEGDLYVWGWNESGQLGLPCPAIHGVENGTIETTAILTLPTYIELNTSIVKVCCGSRHTCILLENGDVMTTGWNKYGQLCLGDTETRDTFTKIDFSLFYNTNTVTDIFSSHWNSFFIVENKS